MSLIFKNVISTRTQKVYRLYFFSITNTILIQQRLLKLQFNGHFSYIDDCYHCSISLYIKEFPCLAFDFHKFIIIKEDILFFVVYMDNHNTMTISTTIYYYVQLNRIVLRFPFIELEILNNISHRSTKKALVDKVKILLLVVRTP